MLLQYEQDRHIELNPSEIAQNIVDYTSGYPFLVSKICKLMDEKHLDWTADGVVDAVKEILIEKNTLFDDLTKKLNDFPKLRSVLKEILYQGRSYSYNPYVKEIELAYMFGYIQNDKGRIKISNRMIETCLYNIFMSEEEESPMFSEGSIEKNQFIENGELNVERILERFIEHYTDIYGNMDEAFGEQEGRKLFMLYLKPIINGTGNYYIEAETRDQTRTDMIIDYLGHQRKVELLKEFKIFLLKNMFA